MRLRWWIGLGLVLVSACQLPLATETRAPSATVGEPTATLAVLPTQDGEPTQPAPVLASATPTEAVGEDRTLTPIGDMTSNYGPEGPGLYGAAGNDLPQFYVPVVRTAVDAIRPLNAQGEASDDGSIGFVAIGMSNTEQVFGAFMRLAATDGEVNPAVVLVNGAQGGVDVIGWNTRSEPWAVVDARLAGAGLTAEQVQVVWLKTEVHNITGYATDYAGQKALRVEHTEATIARLTARFSNLRVIFITSRSYGGFSAGANTSVPEPRSYEHGFAVREVILNRMREARDALAGGADPADFLPVVVCGPYIWAGETPRADGLFYVRADYEADGVHPSPEGEQKIAAFMLAFFRTQPWFGARID